MTRIFTDRHEAGRLLAEALHRLGLRNPVVLALPRGGVAVGLEIAKALQAPMDLLFVRKIGAPGHKEYGIGALVDGASPQIVIDQVAAHAVGASTSYIQQQVALELAEIERRRGLYGIGHPVPLRGRSVIVVDDGIATGNTVRAALQALSHAGAAQVILAVPVAPREVLAELRPLCSLLVCLETPEPFYAVGAHYADFSQASDEEVVQLMQAAGEAAG
jgi:predicted phosphoribosyltransferase